MLNAKENTKNTGKKDSRQTNTGGNYNELSSLDKFKVFHALFWMAAASLVFAYRFTDSILYIGISLLTVCLSLTLAIQYRILAFFDKRQKSNNLD